METPTNTPAHDDELSPIKRALVAIQTLKGQLRALEQAGNEPIAVVGVSCRFPGAPDTDAFWQLLREGRDAIREAPKERWEPELLARLDPANPVAASARWGGFIDGIDRFDAAFFNISPREASAMDPQQRLLLEVTWEALENAGQRPYELAGKPVGVFVGIYNGDYAALQFSDVASADAYACTGNSNSLAAGRIAYWLDLQGPAMVVDTVCSSSLVALHLACASLRRGESTLAIAAGTNAIISPLTSLVISKLYALAPDGRCKSFDAQANGFVRGEGCGVVILKRLSDAQRDGDPIWGVIRGSAVNQDGRSNGLTAPNALAQQAVLRQALTAAGVSPARVSFIETHGTGTPLGDPIEFSALSEVYGSSDAVARCALGSVKTNVGHLESAAGMAGLIKILLALRHGAIPPNLHLRQVNPRITLEGSRFFLPTELVPWPAGDAPRMAALSSFGLSGTNAHVVVEEAPEESVEGEDRIGRAQILLMSGRSEGALRELGKCYEELLRGGLSEREVRDVCYTSARRRTQHEKRKAVVGFSGEELLGKLVSWREGGAGEESGESGKLVFVYPGQGSQWGGMGRTLYEREGVFREAIERCEAAFRPYVEWSLSEELRRGKWEGIDVIQPVLFGLGVSLTEVWRSYGVEPEGVVGHSMGEVAAAVVSGKLSLEDGARVICVRSRLLKRVSGRGSMAVVEQTTEELCERLKEYGGAVSIGVSNSRRSTVVSGESEAIQELKGRLEEEGIFCRLVKVDVASHSGQVDELLEELAAELKGVEGRAGQVPFYSTVEGRELRGEELGGKYWVRNLREPVMFGQTVERLWEGGYGSYVEVSGHPILQGAIEEVIRERGGKAVVVASMRREAEEESTILEGLGALYEAGREIKWERVYGGGRVVELPRYPFQRERYWVETESKPWESAGGAGVAASGHPLLGGKLESSLEGTCFFERELSAGSVRYLSDHRVQGMVVVPGAGYLELGLAAGREVFGEAVELAEVSFEQALVLKEGERRRVQVVVTRRSESAGSFSVASREAGEARSWSVHAKGELKLSAAQPESAEPLSAVRARCAEALDVEEYYERLSQQGLEYGVSFRGLQELYRGEREALGRVQLPEAAGAAERYVLHPALLDASFQVIGAALEQESSGELRLPAQVEKVIAARAAGGSCWAHVRMAVSEGEVVQGTVRLLDDAGEVMAEVQGLALKRLSAGTLPGVRDELDSWLYRFEWQERPRPRAASAPSPGRWLLFADDLLAPALAEELGSAGPAPCIVSPGSRLQILDPAHFTIDPSSVEDYVRLLQTVFPGGGGDCAGIAYLWSVEAPPLELREADIAAAQRLGTFAVLALVQALAQSGWRHRPRLWLVTAGNQAPPAAAPIALTHTPLWGFARTLSHEHPELHCTTIDVDPEFSSAALRSHAAALRLELLAASDDDRVLLRSGARWVGRLGVAPATPQAARDARQLDFREHGTYVITGGLGGLGLTVARWMVSRGARHLVLVSRSEPSAAAQRVLAELAARGADVRALRADVSSRAELAALLAEVRASRPPLRGVMHAAVVLDDGIALRQTPERFARVFAPKIAGALHLHELTQEDALDFFVMFSSAASLFGSPGQSNYAAANAFLDALASYRKSRGLCATSVNFGPWSQIGQAARDDIGARVQDRGVGSLSPEQGVSVLARLLRRGDTTVAVLPLDVRRWQEANPGAPAAAFVDGLRVRPGAKPPVTAFRKQLQAAPQENRLALLASHLQAQLSAVLRLPAERLDAKTPFSSLGLDSLMGLEIRNRLERSLGVLLPATLVWSYSNVAALARHLLDQLRFSQEDAAPAPAAEKAPASNADQRALSEPIAIIGVGCRFPGGVADPDDFWQLLLAGGDAITAVSPERWDATRILAENPHSPELVSSRWGGFIDHVDKFDAKFFGIPEREAALMDPQQRVLLEVSWEALERAGQAPRQLAGSKTGVFVGIYNTDYAAAQLADPSTADAYALTGSGNSFAAGRLAYLLDLQGPALVVDTACSSSLVAVHLACQSLRLGEANLALAAGVSLMLSPTVSLLISKLSVLSPDGHCRPFDAHANGFVRGEGCGVVVLKRLSDAVRDGDLIWGVIRGSAVDQDGRSNGMTAPNGLAQQKVIQEALARAGVRGSDISYVEAHGTGTALGDPIELDALHTALGSRSATQPLLLGSVKANIGHLEAAAGVASLIKVLLAMRHGTIPPQANFTALTPHVSFEREHIRIPTQPLPWGTSAEPRRAGVSSFGMSGTNAHAVVEEYQPPPPRQPGRERSQHLLCLSARTRPALEALSSRFAAQLETPDASLPDIAFSVHSRAANFEHRLAVVAQSAPEAAAALRAAAQGETAASVTSARAGDYRGVAFLFTGQGSQYVGMGRVLFETLPSFRKDLEQCEEILRGKLELPLLSLLYSDNADSQLLEQTRYAQPALFALQYALARVWQRLGVEPSAVMGHSVGEYAAACLAGVFSLEDGLELMAERGRAMQALSEAGAMLSVFAPLEQVQPLLAGREAELAIAAVNGPENVVISGRADSVSTLARELEARGSTTRRLSVSHAFHSPLMDPMLDAFQGFASRVAYAEPRLPLISNLTGAVCAPGQLNAAYWRRHAREPVLFAEGLDALCARGVSAWIEIGPKPTLIELARRAGAAGSAALLPSLRKSQDDWRVLLSSLAGLFVAGADLELRALDAEYPRRKLLVPCYPFERTRYWVDAPGLCRGSDSTPAQLIAEFEWRPAAPAALAAASLGSWWILEDASGHAARLVQALEADGERCRCFAHDTPLDELERALTTADAAEPVVGVVDLRGLTADDDGPLSVRALASAQRLLGLVQALISRSGPSTPKLWLVLPSSWAADAGESALCQSPATGIALTLSHEHPQLWGGIVELDRSAAFDPGALANELRCASGEARVALHGSERRVLRLARRAAADTFAGVRADGSYIVSGGFGALGSRAARWLVERGARHLLLVGRSASSDASLTLVRELESRGASVCAVAADVAQRGEVGRIRQRLAELRWPPLRGVLHAAGVLADALIAAQDDARMARVFAPKVAGTLHLHELTLDQPLDFFVLFSSAASLFGSPGQAGYAAANAFQDAFARYRRGLGLPALSVNWGAFSQAGMAADTRERNAARLARGGFETMSFSDGLSALDQLIAAPVTQAAVLALDWQRLGERLEADERPSLFDELVPAQRRRARAQMPSLRERLATLPPSDAQRELLLHVEGEVRKIMGLADARAIDGKQGFFELGMDSLMALDLKNRLQQSLRHPLPPTFLFNYPNLDSLQSYLAAELLGVRTPADADAADQESAALSEVEQLSELEMERLINHELEQLGGA